MSSDVKRQRVCVFCVCCMLASAAALRGGCGCAESISCCLSGSVKSISLWCCQHSGCAIIITRISAVHPHALQWLIIADFTAAIYSIVRKLKHIICKDWDFITVSFNFGVWSVINYCIVSACLHLHLQTHQCWEQPAPPGWGRWVSCSEPDSWRTAPVAPSALPARRLGCGSDSEREYAKAQRCSDPTAHCSLAGRSGTSRRIKN